MSAIVSLVKDKVAKDFFAFVITLDNWLESVVRFDGLKSITSAVACVTFYDRQSSVAGTSQH